MRTALLMAAAAAALTQPPVLRARLDHLVVGVPRLDAGIASFERMTGVTAARGGQHPRRGTENALVSLGVGRYLELMAPRADATRSPELDELRALEQPTIVAWAVAVSDMAAARQAIAGVGVTLGADTPGSRVTPSGATLEWTTADISAPQIAGTPFFIRWSAATEHPSTTAPTGCTLAALQVEDPAAAELSRVLNALRVSGVTVRRGEARITAALKCPKGLVRIVSRSG